ncbi:CocE/NonD family hydrolase [Nocardioides sp. LS1]|uniref:CocE/NonD family hydrolase n=1 Tax=Nocardioides sp. LS1 TaxID=1027620 RepID=UPI000F627F29|nr:CocE/NonD family hydrolase [Nocardioides sp. LS1]
MSSRVRSAAAVVGLLLLVTGATGAPADAGPQRAHVRSDHVPAAHGTHHWKTIDRLVPVVTGPDDDIAIDLDTRLYVPDNASRRHPQPAILMTHGFGLNKTSPEVVSTARFFAAHGYVVLTYTSSGFGASGGCVTLQSADYDVKSARQLIDKVLEPRRDVRRDARGVVVGTIGGSYGGGIQLPLAAHDQRIRTSVVGRTWNNLIYSLDPNNRVVPGDPTGLDHGLNAQGVFKQEWTSLFYALGNSQPAMGGGDCPGAKQASGDPVEIGGAASCPGYYLPLCRTYELLTSTGDSDAEARHLIRRASASTFLHRIHVPVLLVQGQSDTLFNLNDASATYRALHRRGVPVGMIWNSGGHGGYDSQPGECEAYDGTLRSVRRMDHCYLSLRSLGWMDHWLRGRSGGRGPAFAYYRDWKKYAGHGADDEQYGTSPRFPLHASTTFRISGTDALVAPGKPVTSGSVTMLNPQGGEPAAYTETSNFTGPDASPSSGDTPPTEIDGQFAAFTSAPFARSVAAVGIPEAHLLLTNSNGQDMVFFAKVYDVAPDGSTVLVHRLIAPVRVPAAAVGEPVDIRLAGFAHRFARGHAVRLVLCTTDQTSYNAKVADVLTLSTGTASTFTLPGVLR